MPLPRFLTSHLWYLVLAAGLALAWHTSATGIAHLDTLRAQGGTPVAEQAASPTGYAGGLRPFIALDNHTGTYEWIATTQDMVATGSIRSHHVFWDNAPAGRPRGGSGAFHAWIAGLAGVDHVFGGSSLGVAIERTALHAPFVLLALALVGGGFWVRQLWGQFGAVLWVAALTAAPPLSDQFLAGILDPFPLALLLGFAGLLVLLGTLARQAPGTSGSRAPLMAGVAGALSLWIDPSAGFPLLALIFVGALVHAWVVPGEGKGWRLWGIAGAATVLAAYLLDYAPEPLDRNALSALHPLYGLCWLGMGESLNALHDFRSGRGKSLQSRLFAALGVLALASLPVFQLWKSEAGWWRNDLERLVLSLGPGNNPADNLFDWLARHNGLPERLFLFAPLFAIVPAAVTLLGPKREAHEAGRSSLLYTFTLGSLALAFVRLRFWSLVELASLLCLLDQARYARLTFRSRVGKHAFAALAGLGVALGAYAFVAKAASAGKGLSSSAEVDAIYERDVAQWLSRRVEPGNATVLAPASLSASLAFHGGLRIVVSPYPENRDGPLLGVRIYGTPYADEAGGLLKSRNITHVVFPSWDTSLEDIARTRAAKPEETFAGLIKRWLPPRYLKPLAYHIPKGGSDTDRHALLFEVVEVQEIPLSLSRLAEYFVEMDMPEEAVQVAQALAENFPDDLNGLIARATVYHTAGDKEAFGSVFERVIQMTSDPEITPEWDTRVLRAILLAQGHKPDLSRTEVKRCLDEMDATKLRSLSALGVYRLCVLSKAFALPFPSKTLFNLAKTLVPEEFAGKL